MLTHKDRGYQRPEPGTYAILAGTVALLYDAVCHWGQPMLGVIPAVGLVEYANWRNKTFEEPVEVIITTKAVQKGRILMSDSHIFYINPGDADHYLTATAVTGRHFSVESE